MFEELDTGNLPWQVCSALHHISRSVRSYEIGAAVASFNVAPSTVWERRTVWLQTQCSRNVYT